MSSGLPSSAPLNEQQQQQQHGNTLTMNFHQHQLQRSVAPAPFATTAGSNANMMDPYLFDLLQRSASTIAQVQSSILGLALPTTNAQFYAAAAALVAASSSIQPQLQPFQQQQLLTLMSQMNSAALSPAAAVPSAASPAAASTTAMAQAPSASDQIMVPSDKTNATTFSFPNASSSAGYSHNLTGLPFQISPEVAKLSVQDIAKEAMRISKEATKKQQEQQNSLASDASSEHSSSMGTNGFGQVKSPESLSILACGGNAAIANHQSTNGSSNATIFRLNKFVRRLYEMVKSEQDKGVVEWRRGLLVLHSTATFAKHILPKFFNTRNFKTFRRQLNYYGFVHVRSFSNSAAATTTALWVHQDLAAAIHGGNNNSTSNFVVNDPDDLSLILTLRRVEPNDDHKTVEGRRQRKVMALNTVEEDLQGSSSLLQRQQIQCLLNFVGNHSSTSAAASAAIAAAPVATTPGTPLNATTAVPPVAMSENQSYNTTVAMEIESSSESSGGMDENNSSHSFSVASTTTMPTAKPDSMPTSMPAQKKDSKAILSARFNDGGHEQSQHDEGDDADDDASTGSDSAPVGLSLDEEVTPSLTKAITNKGTPDFPHHRVVSSLTKSSHVAPANGNNPVAEDIIVSESDEDLPPRTATPPKTEKSAANLLLLLSQGPPTTCVTVR